MSSAVRKQAPRLPRPAARYWKGKAPKGVADVPSDSDEEEEQQEVQEEGDVLIGGDQEFGGDNEEEEEEEDVATARPVPKKPMKAMNVALKDVNISRDGKVIVAGREESGKTAVEEEEEEDSEDESEEEGRPRAPGEAESEEESSEYESESEEEEKPKLQFRPVFVPKRARVTVAEREAEAQDTEEALKKKEQEAEERRKQSHDMVAESIKRELAEKEKEEIIPDVDDTDGLDPEGEFEAWRLRELARIKRDKEDEVRREQEREEIERRRALPEEQRLKEDLERAQKTREEKPKGQQKFLQKYWHKGAFHQDEEILRRHDYTEATQSTVDVSLLPKVMQVKNFGKRGRTKYTHLVDQDTTQGNGGFGAAGSVKAGGKSTDAGGCFLCGGPHLKRDCPQNLNLPPGQRPTTGANGVAAGVSKEWGAHNDVREPRGSWKDKDDGVRPRDDGWKDRPSRRDDDGRDDRGTYRDRDRGRGDGYDRRARDGRPRYDSRSRSPPRRDRWRADDRRGSRRHSRSRSLERDRRDKRRRVD
ncbi:hypothetical protein PUNSTDRAFT_78683 [Punctularia strigosozonata HHB-11173 SS5]|uniref:uncharacterized protein n=1 Tax=Punctularia strigosozonata (strain HHB-11173) TaxID=741275 RepID=UPI0004416FE1|nr:uncharacterized protein PUNSTDRAFT_78683 [Punctularia strigosozonata HHB-11173 SS5]EIN13203.1 hypothetical protein PUNSTDRAFT_78683 [Punctularia strigosozonata HHB-11173 SS5]